MFVFEWLFWILLFVISYAVLVFILFKGKQYNRYFGTFLSTIVPVAGSLPAFIMACKYEKRIGGPVSKIDDRLLKYILVGLHLFSVVLLFLPLFKDGSHLITGINLIFGKEVEGNVIKPTLILIYLVIFPLMAATAEFFAGKSNISSFASYSASLINALSMQLLNFVMTSSGTNANIVFWLYSLINLAIMLVSIFAMIKNRDAALFKIEYKEKVDYIKDHKKKEEAKPTRIPDNKMYKCAKCGKFVPKGTICSCIEKKAAPSVDKTAEVKSEIDSAHSFCVYCKRPLLEGESCNCQGDGFGITVKNEENKNRKCVYCGQVLVGESTCVCEKIMKNSSPLNKSSEKTDEPKKYFESQVEQSSTMVAEELAELEKKINSRFESVKESMELKEE